MKVAFNQEVKEKIGKKKEKRLSVRLEHFLLKAAVIAIILLIVVQAAFLNSGLKTILSDGNRLEGKILKEEEYLFVPCKMELKLLNLENCPDLDVLVNGEKCDSFEGKTVLLELKEGDLVELDAGSVLVEAIVQVSAVSSNISDILGKTFTVSDGINPVAMMKPGK